MSDAKPMKMGFERAGELDQVKLGECLWDIHAAGMKILEFTAGRDLDEYSQSELLQSVVHSMLGIIAGRLLDLQRQFPAEFSRLPQGERLIQIGSTPANAPVWRIVESAIPELVQQAREVLEEWHQA